MTSQDPFALSRRTVLQAAAALPAAALAPWPRFGSPSRLEAQPGVEAASVSELIAGNTAFPLDLYAQLREKVAGNLLISPYSLSLALAMAWAGARGETAAQMATILGFTLDQTDLHEAFGLLNADLGARANAGEDADAARTLRIANAAWVERTYPLLAEYIAEMERHYGAPPIAADFLHHPEEMREEINTWVEDETEDRIQDILVRGDITSDTVFVLANAIYFYGSWRSAFDPADTHDGDFYRLDGTTVTVPFMYQAADLFLAWGGGYQAVEFPYAESGFALTVILPDAGRFGEVEASLDPILLETIIGELAEGETHVYLPRFKLELGTLRLEDSLEAMGMVKPFHSGADFSGMIRADIFISRVLHKTFIAIDEKGTEAAAATVVIATPGAGAPVVIDRPFLFAIRDTVTGTVLFLGRVLDPQA